MFDDISQQCNPAVLSENKVVFVMYQTHDKEELVRRQAKKSKPNDPSKVQFPLIPNGELQPNPNHPSSSRANTCTVADMPESMLLQCRGSWRQPANTSRSSAHAGSGKLYMAQRGGVGEWEWRGGRKGGLGPGEAGSVAEASAIS